ncbi:MAG: hypothetical protein K9L17_08960 [Clostridiales bacterium]|nr:hypothetical protein [Clostridiales bacterium]MCF8022806.1 hypothetical protein [Clostridiales bacterium]
MDEKRINALKEAAVKYRNNHPLKQYIVDNTELVRGLREIDNNLLDTGKNFVVSRFKIEFWNYANKVVSQLQKASNSNDIKKRYNYWLEKKAIPFLNKLPDRLDVNNWNDLIDLIMVTDNRIKTLEKVSDVELPSILVEILNVLENKLQDNGLLKKSNLLNMEQLNNIDSRIILTYGIKYIRSQKEKAFIDHDLVYDNVGYEFDDGRQKWHEWRKHLQ